MTGTIKKIITEKGFGFIGREGAERDLYFRSDAVSGVKFEELKEGDAVTFEIDESGPKGPAAKDVQRA